MTQKSHGLFRKLDKTERKCPGYSHAHVVSFVTNPVEQGKILLQVGFIQEIAHSHHYAETYLILTRCLHPFFQVFPKPRLVTADKSFSASKLKRIAHRPAVASVPERFLQSAGGFGTLCSGWGRQGRKGCHYRLLIGQRSSVPAYSPLGKMNVRSRNHPHIPVNSRTSIPA